jgi:tetratricopeptide (TPR) repeat protein
MLWTLALAAYSNSFQAGMVFDNAVVIAKDPRIRAATAQNVELIVTSEYWHTNVASGLYRPLTTLSYLLNYAGFGNQLRPAGYHWVNFSLHGANVSLVYGLGILVFGEPELALALAGIWGLHPLLTESVTNIVGRADLLAAFGVLAGLLCYVRSTPAAGRRKLAWLAAMVAFQSAGLFSKENAAVLPGLMLLYDLTWPARSTWRGRAPAYGALALPFAAFFYLRGQLQMHIMMIAFAENPLAGTDFWTARLTAVKVIGKFLWLFVWPARLAPDYSYNAVPLFGWRPASWEDLKTLIVLAVCLGASFLAVRWRRTCKPLFFFLGFFFIAMLPTSNLVILIGSIMAERFVYLPSVGLAGCLIVALQLLSARLSLKRPVVVRTAWVATTLVCLALAGRTYARNFDWHDDLSLWTRAVNVCPEGARPHYNLGDALARIPGRLPDATAEFEAAIRIRPDDTDAHISLGNALARTPGRLPDAVAEFEAALRVEPDRAAAHYNLGNALAQMPGRLPDAIAEFEAALWTEPDLVDAHYNLGNALARMPGRLPDAIAEFETAVRIRPDLAEAHYTLGSALARMPGRLPDAIAEFEAALRIEPRYAKAHNSLGIALSQIPGRLPDAIAEFEAALRIAPDSAEAHHNLGSALLQMPGRQQDAIAELEAALRIRPDPVGQQAVDRLRKERPLGR